MGLEEYNSDDTPDPSKNFGEQMADMKFGSPNYQDEEWLRSKASDGNLNDRSIAEICEVQPATIRKWRSKYGIESGDVYEPAQCESKLLTPHQLDVIQGSVLGDGGIFKSGSKHIFKLTNGSPEYLRHIREVLPDNIMTENCISKTEHNGRVWYDLHTKNNTKFTELRNKWYSDSGKVLNSEFRFNSTSLLHLYIQDGELTDQYNPRITLSWPNSDEINSLKDQIENWVCRDVRVHTGSNESYAIYIPSDNTEQFFRFIGGPLTHSVEYKWPPEYR